MQIDIHKPWFQTKCQGGFTLIEAMVTVSVMGILLSIAIPSFQSFILNNRLSALTNELATDLYYIRSEALKRRTTVYLCPKKSPSVYSCQRNKSLSDYSNGWIMYVDCNGNAILDGSKVCDADGDGVNESFELLKVHDSFPEEVTINATSAFKRQPGFTLSGRARNTGSFCISLSENRNKKIIIASTGRTRVVDIDSCE